MQEFDNGFKHGEEDNIYDIEEGELYKADIMEKEINGESTSNFNEVNIPNDDKEVKDNNEENIPNEGVNSEEAKDNNEGENLFNTEKIREEIAQQMQIEEVTMQLLQQNPDFQAFDEQLSNDGLIQQPAQFDISKEEIFVSVPYENDDESASISAEFRNGQIQNVRLENSTEKLESSLLWIIPVVVGLGILAVIASKRKSKGRTKPLAKIPIIIKNDQYTISYVDLTREMLNEAQVLYDEELFKDAHEKFSQAIRFYYSNRFSTGTELTNMDALQLLRKQQIPEFDSILDYLGMCEMIEFAKNPSQKKKFFSAIENFSEIIE